jgi:TonB family protein
MRPLTVACALALAACVTTTTTEFSLAPGGQRLTPLQVRDQGDGLVRAECPRLLGAGQSASGAADVRITVDREGSVSRAVVERGSGDQRMDQLFGTLAAALDFEPPEGMTASTMDARVEMGYSCSPTVAVITFRVRPPAGTELAPLPPGA